METGILLEVFSEAERIHGVIYTRFIGDGDSSVYPTLLERVPGGGYAIQKVECANHAYKCYRSGLERGLSRRIVNIKEKAVLPKE